jgi:hypothetical protein
VGEGTSDVRGKGALRSVVRKGGDGVMSQKKRGEGDMGARENTRTTWESFDVSVLTVRQSPPLKVNRGNFQKAPRHSLLQYQYCTVLLRVAPAQS